MVKSIYIHIPFCNHICSYCDFSKLFYNEELVNKYLDCLENEIKLRYKGELINTIYIGGGTPSSLSIDQLNKLFSIISKFNLSSDVEFTFEANFDSINEEKLLLLKKYKVNRLSFGIETFNNKFLKDLNRFEDYDIIYSKIKLAKSLGFNNINVDLMYGFNNQTINDLKDDLDKIISLNINHISTYSLIIEKNTELYINKYNRIDDDLDNDMYYYIIDYLSKFGFKHYEISNFSKDNYYSKHNLTYWNNLEYYGFGLSAASYINNVRINNTRSITQYLKNNYKFEEEIVSNDDKMTYEMILGLRKIEGVNKKEFKNKFGVKIEDKFDIIDLINKKLLIDKDGYIYIPKDKLYVSNMILLNFIGGKNGKDR